MRHVPSIEKVRFVSSGTEATMSALRVARGFTGRRKILKFDGCYHGHADSLLVAAGSGVATLGIPGSPGRARGHGGRHARRPVQRRRRGRARSSPPTGATSPRSSSSPCAGTWARSRRGRATSRRCARSPAKSGTVLIFDEVMTGFRLALGGAQQLYGVDARHDLPRQDRRRRAARRGLRRPRRHHGHRRARRARSTRPARSRETRWRWPRVLRSWTSSRSPAATRRSRRGARGSRRACAGRPATPGRRSRSTASAR